jgi:hypothetical protein
MPPHLVLANPELIWDKNFSMDMNGLISIGPRIQREKDFLGLDWSE